MSSAKRTVLYDTPEVDSLEHSITKFGERTIFIRATDVDIYVARELAESPSDIYDGHKIVAINYKLVENQTSLQYLIRQLNYARSVSNQRTAHINPFVQCIFKCYYTRVTEETIKDFGKLTDIIVTGTERSKWQRTGWQGEIGTWVKALSRHQDKLIIATEMEYFPDGTALMMESHGGDNLKQMYFDLCWAVYCIQRDSPLHHYYITLPNVLVRKYAPGEQFDRRLCLDKEFHYSWKRSDDMYDYFLNTVQLTPDITSKYATQYPRRSLIDERFECPTPFLELQEQDPAINVIKGSHSDVWNLGHLFLARALYGFQGVPTVATVITLFWKLLKDNSIFYGIVTEITNAVQKELLHVWVTEDYVSSLVIWCGLQEFIGNGFLPRASSDYKEGILHKLLAKHKNKILNLGKEEDFLESSATSSLFEEAIAYVAIQVGSPDGMDFIKRHLAWLPEQRRVFKMEVAEHGDFLFHSLGHPFLSDYRTTNDFTDKETWGMNCWENEESSSSDEESSGEESTAEEHDFLDIVPRYQMLLLGKSINYTNYHCIIVDTRTQEATITSRQSGLPLCEHTFDPDTLVRQLREIRTPTDKNVCPICMKIK